MLFLELQSFVGWRKVSLNKPEFSSSDPLRPQIQ